MKSRITIEVDFDNGNMPTIQILHRKSDDVRDSLIQNFLQSLAHTSRWCKILYCGTVGHDPLFDEGYKWQIYPLVASEIPQEMELMKGVLERINENNPDQLSAKKTIQMK